MRIISLVLCLCIAFPLSAVYAGNKKMVEKEVKELDELNKQAVQQLPDLPKDGTIDLKAKVTQENGETKIDILHHRVTPKKTKIAPLKKKHLAATPVVQETIDLGSHEKIQQVEGEATENEPNSD